MEDSKKDNSQLLRKFLGVCLNLGVLFGVVQVLYYLLKHVYFVEAEVILGAFFAVYGVIVLMYVMKYRKIFFVRHLWLTFVLGVVAYNYVTYPSYTYRYRMTVEVDTPEGVKMGSSVVEVKTEQWNSWWTGMANGHSGQSRAYGEGVFIEMEGGKNLLVLLEAKNDVDHAEYMLPYAVPMKEWDIDWSKKDAHHTAWYRVKSRKARKYYGTLSEAKGILPRSIFPTMFVVSKKEEEIEVTMVDSDNINKLLGQGFDVNKITIETTDNSLEHKLIKLDIWKDLNNNKKLRYKQF